jgi:hypothetical protein
LKPFNRSNRQVDSPAFKQIDRADSAQSRSRKSSLLRHFVALVRFGGNDLLRDLANGGSSGRFKGDVARGRDAPGAHAPTDAVAELPNI